MQRLLFGLISSFFIIVSCSKVKDDNLLAETKMTELLTEVHLVDGYLSTLPKDSAVKVLPVMYGSLFKKYNLDSTTFTQNLNFYMGNPQLVEKVYGRVNKKLQAYNREIIVSDSLLNVRSRDSIMRVQRLQKNAADLKRLITNGKLDTLDTLSMTYMENGSSFYDRTSLPYKIYGVHIPLVIEAAKVPVGDSIPPTSGAPDSTKASAATPVPTDTPTPNKPLRATPVPSNGKPLLNPKIMEQR